MAVLERQAEQEHVGRSFGPWSAFAVASVAQFMVILDASIMNVALPSIQRGLHFSAADLQWVINIYVLMFGGFLLLGGRAGDLFGRRKMFMIGLVVLLARLAGWWPGPISHLAHHRSGRPGPRSGHHLAGLARHRQQFL
jgi:MFS family permease